MKSIHLPRLPRALQIKLMKFAAQLPAIEPSGRGAPRDPLGLAIEEAMRREVARRMKEGKPGAPSRLVRVVDGDVAAALDRLRGPGESMASAVILAIRHLNRTPKESKC